MPDYTQSNSGIKALQHTDHLDPPGEDFLRQNDIPVVCPRKDIDFVRDAPGKVIANHLDALNHCPVTREQLKQALENNGLLSKTFIPDDGEILSIETG